MTELSSSGDSALNNNQIKAELDGHFYQSRLRLRFLGDLEHRYRRYCSRRDRRYILDLVSILVGFYVVYGAFDWYLLGNAVEAIWQIRYFLGLPVLIGVLILLRSRRCEPHLDKIVVVGLSWLSLCTLLMAKTAPEEVKGMYLASELAIVMVGLNITRMRFWNCVVTGLLFVVSVPLILPPVGDDAHVMMYYACLCLGSTGLCILAQYGVDRSSRREFLQKQMIYKKNRQLEKLNQKLKGLAEVDALSGLANRRHFDQVLDEEWRRARRRGYSLALLMCDIDFFKAYNDALGHPQGDECIKQVALSLKDSARRPGDLVARYGGEEFAVVLPALGVEEAEKIAAAICHNVEALKIAHPESQVSDFVTISVGVAACIPDQYSSKTELISWADDALYKAKTSGRNRVKTFAKAFA